ncbi:protein NRT1/ PTR FAMILY 2.13 [Citrus sinensis]|uniref:Protein NRT1/ PTR FAMILY 2.13 n=2 Tax=Citrus TaxID=2706 RepID=A0ACB8LJZ9_CITSI|nr:protein NRT1/ PTR FAMILY 2.13 [Citrus sinensis]
MSMVTLMAIAPQLRPTHCTNEERIHGQCIGPNRNQLAFLHVAMFWLAVGGGGIRPCSIPFTVDQFDSRTDKGRKAINSFFNWYYTTFTLVLLITSTVVAYVQTVSWAWGFTIPTVCFFCGLVLLFAGMRIYELVIPEGGVFSSIVQVFVVAYKKRRHQLQSVGDGIFYDPPLKKTLCSKLPLTSSQFRFLKKAAIIDNNDEIKQDGMCMNPRRLCSIQQVEEVNWLMIIVPIWASAIISFLPMQIGTFVVGQAMRMDRHLGPKFEIPIPSIFVISLIIIMATFLPIYDRCLVPTLEKFTKQEGGITLLQRIGLGKEISALF